MAKIPLNATPFESLQFVAAEVCELASRSGVTAQQFAEVFVNKACIAVFGVASSDGGLPDGEVAYEASAPHMKAAVAECLAVIERHAAQMVAEWQARN